MLLSANSYAAYYYSKDDGVTQYPSAEAACTVILSTYTDVGQTNLSFNHWGTIDDTGDPSVFGSGYCYYNRTNKWDEITIKRHPSVVKRYGTADHVSNACANAASAIVSRGPYGSVVQSDGKNYVVAPSPSSVCSDNCLYEKPESANTKDCFLLATDAQTGFCNYGFTLVTDNAGDGSSCTVNTSVPYETGTSLNGTGSGTGDDECDTTVPNNTCDASGDGSGDGSDDGSGDGSSSNDGFKTPGKPDLDPREGQRKPRIESQYLGFSSTFQESLTYTTIKNSFQNIGDPGAACPVATIDLFGSNITFDSHCIIFDSIAPTLSFVFMAAWALLAVFIILSA